jgi:hypothetical protein
MIFACLRDTILLVAAIAPLSNCADKKNAPLAGASGGLIPTAQLFFAP